MDHKHVNFIELAEEKVQVQTTSASKIAQTLNNDLQNDIHDRSHFSGKISCFL